MAEVWLYARMGVKESMSSSASASPRDSKSSSGVIPPITEAGIVKYCGILAGNILLTGALPKGEMTQTVTYVVVDRDTKEVVSETRLPNASDRLTGVRMLLPVKRECPAYEVGTLTPSGEFRAIDFLSASLLPRAGAPSATT
jgi:hypothetical protein